MPDDDKSTNELIEEAKQSLLEAIIEKASTAGTGQLETVARAYALVVGAKWGTIPGAPTSGS